MHTVLNCIGQKIRGDSTVKKALTMLLSAVLLAAALTGAAIATGEEPGAQPPGPLTDVVYVKMDWPILVDGVRIEAPPPLRTDDGCRMVPLRAVAEALGYKVQWHGGTKTITLDDSISLAIGENRYVIGDNVIEVDCYALKIPIIMDGFTYVPICFFRDMLEMSESNSRDGMIQIITSKS